ncbi:MAG TPA: DUF4381 domain-containing protein [Rhodanobacteraceae bacterium]|nr:DUF4381 domain-containing protein [Rhodanobacteraceae bacterium]
MNASGPTLRDIHVPPVSWWPPAIGWWLLAAFVLVVIVVGVLLALHWRRRARPGRAVRRELDTLATCFAQNGDAQALAAGLSKLLRRVALMLEPVAATRGSAEWRAFLESRAPGTFDDEQMTALLEAPYRPHSQFDAEALLAAVGRWCERALRKEVRQPA